MRNVEKECTYFQPCQFHSNSYKLFMLSRDSPRYIDLPQRSHTCKSVSLLVDIKHLVFFYDSIRRVKSAQRDARNNCRQQFAAFHVCFAARHADIRLPCLVSLLQDFAAVPRVLRGFQGAWRCSEVSSKFNTARPLRPVTLYSYPHSDVRF